MEQLGAIPAAAEDQQPAPEEPLADLREALPPPAARRLSRLARAAVLCQPPPALSLQLHLPLCRLGHTGD